jgi:tetratricopeptide (TPR) repeat protein
MEAKSPAIWICLAILAGTVILYGHSLRNDFVNFDDETYVVNNQHVRGGITPAGLKWAWTASDASNWHPLTWISLQLDWQLYTRDRSRGFHLTNLLLHAINSGLLFLVLMQMTGACWPSGLAAALFAWHPLHVESVAWVTERKDVLSTLFWLLALWAYARYARKPTLTWYSVALLVYALGLCAKPMLVTLPFVLLLLDYWPLGRTGHSEIKKASDTRSPNRHGLAWLLGEKVPFMGLAAGSCAITLWAQKGGGALSGLDYLPLNLRVENAIVSYVRYLQMTFWPVELAAYYPHPLDHYPVWMVAGAAAILLALTGVAVAFGRKFGFLPVGWFWYLGTLVPVIGVVQVGQQALADRYTYIPLIGIFVILSFGLAELWKRLPAAWAIGGVAAALVGCMILSWQQIEYWSDSVTLWKHAIEVTSNNYFAHNNLGQALEKKAKTAFDEILSEGKMEEAGATQKALFDQAIQHYTQAIEIKPKAWLAHYNRGVAYADIGKRELARADFQAAVEQSTDFAAGYYNLALIQMEDGDVDAAIDLFGRAVKANPPFIQARTQLGRLFLQRARYGEATDQFQAILDANPRDGLAWSNLGTVRAVEGKDREAIECFRKAIECHTPNPATYFELAYLLSKARQADEVEPLLRQGYLMARAWPQQANNAAWELATSPNAQKRGGALALHLAQLSSFATEDRQPDILDTLAAAQAEVGQFEQAEKTARKALGYAAGSNNPNFKQIEDRIKVFQRKEPWREKP